MKPVFADSFYFFALLNPRDPAHTKAVAFTQAYTGQIVTTGWVLTELADGWAKPISWRHHRPRSRGDSDGGVHGGRAVE